MVSPPPDAPPYVPLRNSRWPSYRTPRWLLLAGVVVLVGAVLVGWAIHPTRGQRAVDMDGFLANVTTDIRSCAAGVSESLQALHEIRAGTQRDVAIAISIATTGGQTCSPANSMQMDDLTQYQVHESLANLRLGTAVNDMVTWAFPHAQRVQYDVAAILSAHSAPVKAAATAKLAKDLRALDAVRAQVYAILRPAVRSTGATAPLPYLPG